MSAATVAHNLHRALTTAPTSQRFFDALAAADEHLAKVDELGYLASFAPPPRHYAQCVCGSVFEIRTELELTEDDYEAIRDWQDVHLYCEGGDL